MLGMVLRLPEGSGKKARFEAFKGPNQMATKTKKERKKERDVEKDAEGERE